MAEREFDAGLDTPTAYEPGAGWPVPGSPVWEDARLRERENGEQLKAEQEAAANPQRGDEVKPNVTDSKSIADTGDTQAAKKAAAADKAATADKAAAAKK